MAKKRSLNRKSVSKKTPSLEQRVTAAQAALKAGQFEDVLPQLAEIRRETTGKPEFARIYLTSFIWEVRALAALGRPQDEIQSATKRYRDEAKALGDAARQAQAELILAQARIDVEDFDEAEVYLESALDLALDIDDDGQVFRALMGLARVQMAQLRFPEAVDILGRAKAALPELDADSPAQLREQRAYIESECVDLYEKLGDGQAAQAARARFLDLAKQGFGTENLKILETLYQVKTLDLAGKAAATCAAIRTFKAHVSKNTDADAVVQSYVARFEHARAEWKCGRYQEACSALDALRASDIKDMPIALVRAIDLSRLQYRTERISCIATIDAELDAFRASLEGELPRTVAELNLAVDLCQASVYIYRGRFRTAHELLEFIVERSKFMRLGNVMTPAHASFARLALRMKRFGAGLAWVELAENGFERAGDKVNLLLTRALKWRLKLGLAQGEGDKALARFAEEYAAVQSEFEAELAYFEVEKSHEACLNLALVMGQIAEGYGDKDKAIDFWQRASKRRVDDYKPAAHIALYRLEGRLFAKPALLERAALLAQETCYYDHEGAEG